MAQEILWGADHLAPLLKDGRCFLIHGNSFCHLPIYPYFQHLDYVEFTNFSPNPTYEQVCEALKVFQRSGCDRIMAVGGGSAIDVAKCVKRFAEMDPESDLLNQTAPCSDIPLTALPTTAGTGSESTHFAVIYHNGKKCSVAHPAMLPNQVILEPDVLCSLPLYQKKCTMLDALCQAIESIWARKATEESKSLAKRAILSIRENWHAYLVENDPGAARKIMEAANLAGQAIDQTTTTAPHAMSYQLTSLYGLPHGHAVGLCMSEVWTYTRAHIDDCLEQEGRTQLIQALKEIEALISPEWFDRLLDELQMERPTAGDREKELALLTESVNPERLGNHPIKLDTSVLRMLYEGVVKL